MNSKQKKTLEDIFRDPTSRSIIFADMESLLRSIGCDIDEGVGSHVTFLKDGLSLDVHRPHPRKEAKPYQVKDVRHFLLKLGITP